MDGYADSASTPMPPASDLSHQMRKVSSIDSLSLVQTDGRILFYFPRIKVISTQGRPGQEDGDSSGGQPEAS